MKLSNSRIYRLPLIQPISESENPEASEPNDSVEVLIELGCEERQTESKPDRPADPKVEGEPNKPFGEPCSPEGEPQEARSLEANETNETCGRNSGATNSDDSWTAIQIVIIVSALLLLPILYHLSASSLSHNWADAVSRSTWGPIQ